MKKSLIATILFFSFTACEKDSYEDQSVSKENMFFQIESEDFDGKILKSEILILKL